MLENEFKKYKVDFVDRDRDFRLKYNMVKHLYSKKIRICYNFNLTKDIK